MWETVVRFWEFLVRDSGGVVGIFTVVLAVTTIIYVIVTAKLLKQSRNALLADITLRVMETCREELRAKRKGEEGEGKVLTEAWLQGYCKTFAEIDKGLGIDINNLFGVCLETTIKEYEEGRKKFKEEEEVGKKNKKPGTS